MSGKPKRIPTQEEYEQDKQIILEAYRQGLPVRRMLNKFNYTRTYISKMRSVLIAEGKITEAEMQAASEKYYAENPSAQGLNKSKVRKPKGTEKSEKRHNRSLERKNRVLELAKQGYIKSEIAKKVGISETAVEWNIKRLIDER